MKRFALMLLGSLWVVCAFLTINAETYAAEQELNFMTVENLSWESKTKNPYAIAHLEKESFTVFIKEIADTEYGTVLYYNIGGMPHGPYTRFLLVDYDGNEYPFEGDPIPADTVYGRAPEFENLKISDDGRYLTFSVSFDDRLVATLGDTPQTFHDAGTYYFKCDLKEHTRVETDFEPLDIMGEEEISPWAKSEVEKAIEWGFVPITLRENYKKNITRAEFTRMAMCFLSVQYGYQPEHILRVYGNTGSDFSMQDFLAAYCSVKKDRNGNDFISAATGEKWQYEEKRNGGILLQYDGTRFTDLNKDKASENALINIAYAIGIVNGVSVNSFRPDGNITRQEAAAMLMRIYKNYAEFDGKEKAFLFSDDEYIADWAKEDVYSIQVLGVMQGVGESAFAPQEEYTVEQAIATFLRLYESAPISRKNKNIAPLVENEKDLYFANIPGTATFSITSENDYGEYTVITGMRGEPSEKKDNKIYVFYKYGGMRDLLSFVPTEQENNSATEEVEVNAKENMITFMANVSDTFRLYNKLNGTEKVYDTGKYQFEIDLATGNILRLVRIS